MVYRAPEYNVIYTSRYIEISRYIDVVIRYVDWSEVSNLHVLYIWLVYILVSSYPCLYVLACILIPLHLFIFRFICPCLHPCILISLGSCVLACILTSSYPQVHVCLLLFLHPHVLISSSSCVLVGILASSYPQVYVCLLVCSHPQINVFSIQMNNCILASSSSLVLTNCASQFN